MIRINFNEKNFNDFVNEIEPVLKKKFNSVLKNKTDEEKEFLVFLKDVIGLKKIITAIPDNFILTNCKTFKEIEDEINLKKFQLRQNINKTITPTNFNKYLKKISSEKLQKIMQLNNIKRNKATKKEEFIKRIKNHTFNKNNKILFKKEYFILRVEEFCKEIFEKFYLEEWDKIDYTKYVFVENIDIKTCPYCNRNYIFIYDEGKIRPEIDHFFPKSHYPYFAMSYFNLIPCCHICNHTKLNKFDINLVNPYSLLTNETKIDFSIDVKNVNFTNIKKDKYDFNSFSINVNSKNNKNLEIFQLKELYKQHKDIVVDLLIKNAYYPSQYIQYLRSYGFSEEEIYKFIFNSFIKDEELHKRPLSKLIKDIAIELKLIR